MADSPICVPSGPPEPQPGQGPWRLGEEQLDGDRGDSMARGELSPPWSALTWSGQQLLDLAPQPPSLTLDRVVAIARQHVVRTLRAGSGSSTEGPAEAVSILRGPHTVAVVVGVPGEVLGAAVRVEVLLASTPRRRHADHPGPNVAAGR